MKKKPKSVKPKSVKSLPAPNPPPEASPPQAEPKPKPRQNSEVMHFFNSEYTSLNKVMSEAFLTLATYVEQLPESFSKAVALRHLLEARDWTSRAQYIKPVEQWVTGQPNVEFIRAFAIAK